MKFPANLHASQTKVNVPRLIYIRRIAVIIIEGKSAPQDTSSRRLNAKRIVLRFTYLRGFLPSGNILAPTLAE